MIKRGDKRIYTHPKLIRTKYFIPRALAWAEALSKLLVNWPRCPECRSNMSLIELVDAYNNKIQEYEFVCDRLESHSNQLSMTMDFETAVRRLRLSKNAHYHLGQYFSKRKYYIGNLSEGKRIGVARDKRNTVVLSRPYNIE